MIMIENSCILKFLGLATILALYIAKKIDEVSFCTIS